MKLVVKFSIILLVLASFFLAGDIVIEKLILGTFDAIPGTLFVRCFLLTVFILNAVLLHRYYRKAHMLEQQLARYRQAPENPTPDKRN